MYIHQRKGWPDFFWDEARVSGMLADARHLQGRLLERMETLGFQLREEATFQALMQVVSGPAGRHRRRTGKSDGVAASLSFAMSAFGDEAQAGLKKEYHRASSVTSRQGVK